MQKSRKFLKVKRHTAITVFFQIFTKSSMFYEPCKCWMNEFCHSCHCIVLYVLMYWVLHIYCLLIQSTICELFICFKVLLNIEYADIEQCEGHFFYYYYFYLNYYSSRELIKKHCSTNLAFRI